MFSIGDYVTHDIKQPMSCTAGLIGVVSKMATGDQVVVKFFDDSRTLGYVEELFKQNELRLPESLPEKLPTPMYFRSNGVEYFYESDLPHFKIVGA